MGLELPARPLRMSLSTLVPRAVPADDPGRAKPDAGRAVEDIGRTAALGPVRRADPLALRRDVPGLQSRKQRSVSEPVPRPGSCLSSPCGLHHVLIQKQVTHAFLFHFCVIYPHLLRQALRLEAPRSLGQRSTP